MRLHELSEGDLVLVDIGREVSVLQEDVTDLRERKGQYANLFIQAIERLTSHSVAAPI
jgi:hypothetical protein